MKLALLCAGALVVLSGCYRTIYYVDVPNTVEGNKCVRECQLIEATCQGARRVDLQSSCRNRMDDCLYTCPGAREVEERVPYYEP